MDKLIIFLEKLASQRHILALRDGMLGSIPIILVGSVFLFLGAQSEVLTSYFGGQVAWLPNWVDTTFGQWYLTHSGDFYMPYRLTMGLLGLYIAFTVAAALATQYKMSPVAQGLGSVATLLVTSVPQKIEGQWMIALKPLGPDGIFLGIIVAILTVEISRLFLANKEAAKDEVTQSIPPAVMEAFRGFLPLLVSVSLIWLLRHACNLDVNELISKLMSPLVSLGDTLWAVLLSNLFLHLFAVAGIHGISVINAIMLPLWQQFVAANAEAHSAGLALPHVTAYPFYQWFVWFGGSGATLAPILILFTFKNPHYKKVGKMAIIPSLFNINEPFLFGLPVIANPVLAIPCVLAPMICGTVAWFAISWGLVQAPFIEVPWIMPCFLGALLSTQDLRSLLLLAVNFCISAAVWYPFLKRHSDKIGGV